MTPDEEDDYKLENVYLLRSKRAKNPHRSRTRSNAKKNSKGSTTNDYPFHDSQGGFESLLVKLIKALENNSRTDDSNVSNSSATNDTSSFDDEDLCQKWLDNWEKLEKAFPGKNDTS